MQPFQLKTSWHDVKEKLKEINIDLSDEDLDYRPGNEEELLTKLQQKINTSKENIRAIIESISGNEGKAG